MPAWVSDTIAWWASVYGNHASVALTVTFLHVAGVVVGGGTALAVDRQIVRGRRASAEHRRCYLRMAADAHRPVLAGLLVTAGSGLLLLLSDLETFIPSRLFWIKMSAFALLVANGVLVVLAERRARRTDDVSGWPRLAAASVASATLWMAIVFLGEWLPVGA